MTKTFENVPERISNLTVLEELFRLEKEFYKVLTDPKKHKERFIYKAGPYQAGLELAGVHSVTETLANVVLWGSRENQYFNDLEVFEAEAAIKRVVTLQPPAIFLSNKIDKKWLSRVSKMANECGVIVVCSKMHTREVSNDLYRIMAPIFAPSVVLHASAMVVDNVGILIMGLPGIGKSEALVDLINRGHYLIGDDSIVVKKIGAGFTAEASRITKNFLEVRGIGIINALDIYGWKHVVDKHAVDLVVKLIRQDLNVSLERTFQRLGFDYGQYEILNSSIPYVELPVSMGRNISSLIELASSVFKTRTNRDYLPIDEQIKKRFLDE